MGGSAAFLESCNAGVGAVVRATSPGLSRDRVTENAVLLDRLLAMHVEGKTEYTPSPCSWPYKL
jgi:hypothetical protein